MTDCAQVYVPLPNHWAVPGEALWAQPLGDGLYQLQSSPFYAYALNFLDVVLATPGEPELPPQVRRVVRRSGHATLRVVFFESVPETERAPLLTSLAGHEATFEAADERYFVLDVDPAGDLGAVRQQLDAWESAGMLEYETCEARREDSFDDVACDEDASE